MDRYLRNGYGAGHLADPRIASLVAEALEHFNDSRYRLFAWCIMPNHVHVVCRPCAGWDLDRLIHSWKSFTAFKSNRILGKKGPFWMREYHNRIIWTRSQLHQVVRYVLDNPVKAGLKDWQWVRLYDLDGR